MSIVQKTLTDSAKAANRRNAQKSTGPKTPAGKTRADGNAIIHGAYSLFASERMELLGEDPQQFENFRETLRKGYDPRDLMEEMVVEELALNRWRHFRAVRAESGVLAAGRRHFEHASKEYVHTVREGKADDISTLIIWHKIVEAQGLTQNVLKHLEYWCQVHPTDETGAAVMKEFKLALELATKPGPWLAEAGPTSERFNDGESQKKAKECFLSKLTEWTTEEMNPLE